MSFTDSWRSLPYISGFLCPRRPSWVCCISPESQGSHCHHLTFQQHKVRRRRRLTALRSGNGRVSGTSPALLTPSEYQRSPWGTKASALPRTSADAWWRSFSFTISELPSPMTLLPPQINSNSLSNFWLDVWSLFFKDDLSLVEASWLENKIKLFSFSVIVGECICESKIFFKDSQAFL